MNRKHLFFLLFSFVYVAFYQLNAQTARISGCIKDTTNTESLIGANVVLLNATDSAQVMVAATNPQGCYRFSGVKAGKYIVMVLFIDYARSFTAPFVLKRNQETVLPTIYLSKSATDLEGIEIVATKKRYQVEDDKVVLNVDNAVIAAASSAFDLLKKAPGVSIDQEDNISLNGSSGVAIHFDGREIKLPQSALVDMLKGMPASNVMKIEVMNDPSAKYDAEGSAGILNILFAKEHHYGWNGSVDANAAFSNLWNAGAGINLNRMTQKSSLSIAYNYSRWGWKSDRRSENYRQRVNGDTVLTKHYEPTFRMENSHNINVGGDYRLTSKDIIGANVRYNYRHSPFNEILLRYDMYHSGNQYATLDSFYTVLPSQSSSAHNFATNLNYNHQFDSLGHELKVAIDGTYYRSESFAGTQNRYYTSSDPSSFSFAEQFSHRTPVFSGIGVLRADYTRPIHRTFRMETGIKNTIAHSDHQWQSDFLDQSSGKWQNDHTLSNQFRYTDNVVAAYLSFNKQIAKIVNLRFGLRAEHTSYRGHQVVGDSVISDRYTNLFPNLRIGYTVNESNTLSVDYSYRLNRPAYSDLNPFVRRNDAHTYSSGNPYLKPDYSHALSFSYAWNYKIFVNLRYNYTDGRSMQGIKYDPETMISIKQPMNMGVNQRLNLSLSINHEFFDWWQIYVNGGGRYMSNMAVIDGQKVVTDLWSGNIFGNTTFLLPRKWSIEIFGHYASGFVRGLTKSDGYRAMDIGVKKTLWNDKMDIRLSVGGLFTADKRYAETVYPKFSEKSWREPTPIRIGLSIRFLFGEVSNKKKSPARESVEEFDRLRSKDNSESTEE